MSDDGKLIKVNIDLSSLEGLSESVKIMVSRISREIGDFTKPYHVRRIAQAKADVAIIEAETQNRISEVQERGLRRMVVEEGKRQENIESIIEKAIPYVHDGANTDKLSGDWITSFFDKCRLISDVEMQGIWARLLAQEGNQPNSVSKRTLTLLASLDKKDADLFTKFCSHVWMMGSLTALVYDEKVGPTVDLGITFNALTHLDSIGLITFNSMSGFKRLGFEKYATVFYYGRL